MCEGKMLRGFLQLDRLGPKSSQEGPENNLVVTAANVTAVSSKCNSSKCNSGKCNSSKLGLNSENYRGNWCGS